MREGDFCLREVEMGFERLLEETPEAYYWIGFLMADGHLSNKPKQWEKYLDNWFNRIFNIIGIDKKFKYPSCNIDKRDGSVRMEIYNRRVLLFLKNIVINLDLPVLNRKWDRVREYLIKSRNNKLERTVI